MEWNIYIHFFWQVNEDQVPPLSETDMCETATLCGEA